VVTASRGGVPTAVARPVTAIRGAGYTSSRLATASQVYDPLNQSGRVTTPFSEPKAVDPYVAFVVNQNLLHKIHYNFTQARKADENAGK
jgi:hypothetical protein